MCIKSIIMLRIVSILIMLDPYTQKGGGQAMNSALLSLGVGKYPLMPYVGFGE
jgi:hypothetical protein